ncbi:hypothetical protein PUG81_28755 [Erwiniaceae bacterium L1_54_6]|jgi:hypothetical protein|nr:hypothetical protein [Erwiniaceae bacterium L1_54_6]
MHFLQVRDGPAGAVSGMLILRPKDARQGTVNGALILRGRANLSCRVGQRPSFFKVMQCDRRHGQQRCRK